MAFRDKLADAIYFLFQIFTPPQTEGKYPLINGVPASKAQIELALSMNIKEKYVNYPLCGYFVDIALPRKRVAIEYDGRFWHQRKRKDDLARARAINRCGWKVLSILTDKIPPADLVWEWVRELEKSREKYLIKEY